MRRRLLALLVGASGLFAGAPGLLVAAAPTGLVLSLGALGMFAAPPAQAQDTVTLVSNAGQTRSGGILVTGSSLAAGFTTGSARVMLSSIEVYTYLANAAGLTPEQRAAVRFELWSATAGGAPGSKLADLTVPAAAPRTLWVSARAPANTVLAPNTAYFFVHYSEGTFQHGIVNTTSHDEDPGGDPGWSILDKTYLSTSSPPGGWTDVSNIASSILWFRVKGMDVDPPAPAPQDLLLTPAGEGLLSVSWRPPSGTVRGYEVQYTSAAVGAVADDATTVGTNPSTGWVAVDRPTDARTGASSIDPGQGIMGLTAGREYRVRVRGKNSAGASPWAVASGTVRSRNLSRIPWAASLTVQDGGASSGCISASQCSTALTDNDATDILGGAIQELKLDSGSLEVKSTAAFPSWRDPNSFTRNQLGADYPKLCVDGTTFAFTDDKLNDVVEDGRTAKRSATWQNSGLNWTAGDKVGLSIITHGSCPSSYAELIQLIAH